MSAALSDGELAALEAAVGRALAAGDAGPLDILGYGEISLVVRWPAAHGAVAAKRLPPFPDEASFAAHRRSVERYLRELAAAGIQPLATAVKGLERPDGSFVGYCLQPVMPAETLASVRWRRWATAEAVDLLDRIWACIAGGVSPRLGVDGQASNWLLDGAELRYLDVTTPLLRGAGISFRLGGSATLRESFFKHTP